MILLLLLQDSFDVESKGPQAETRELVEFLEAARKAYLDILKPDEIPTKKLKLVVHADRDAYLKAGGPAGSGAFYDGKKLAGYWDPDLAKACFAHELVHHLIHATSQYFFSFPEWFHEGFADALATIEIDGDVRLGRMSGAIPKMRLWEIQKALQDGKAYALSDLLKMGAKRFKEGSTLTYAQSWSLCQFLLEKHRAKILNYYRLLRAGGTNHDKAWAKAFESVKLADLEKEWKEHVGTLVYFPVRLAGKRYLLRTSETEERGRDLLEFMEKIYPLYEELFEAPKTNRRMELWLYSEAEAYLKGGWPAKSEGCYREGVLAGYWDASLMKPVFAHEGVHQFLDLVGGGPYPKWFAEGVADVFANFEVREGKHYFGTKSGPIARSRLPAIRNAVCRGKEHRLAKLFEIDAKTFFEDGELCYAQAWSFCHFLMAYPAEEDRTRVLPEGRYRANLREFYAKLRAGTAPAKAWALAFAGISLDELELQWKLYVLTLDGGRTLGIQGEETAKGIRIFSVLAGGPGEAAGLKYGDVLVRFQGRAIETWATLQEELGNAPWNEPVRIVVVRDGKERELTTTYKK